MKPLKFIIFIFSISAIILLCCKNQSDIDYRDSYTGDYQFSIIATHLHENNLVFYKDSSEFFGEITCGKEDSLISIHYLKNSFIEPTLKSDKSLNGINRFSGKFLSNSIIEFTISWGGHGGGSSHKVRGLKEIRN